MIKDNLPYKIGDVVTLKINSGEEVIGRLESENEYDTVLSKPQAFMMGPQGLGLVPYLFSAPESAKVGIRTSSINTIIKTVDAVANQYLKQTTGLVLPNA